jgi:Domain of unknown function (DUF4279)
MGSCRMSQISMTSVSLRFSDKDSSEVLIPDALTSALGKPPTSSRTKGEIMRTPKGTVIENEDGTPRINDCSTWHYSVEMREPGDLDGQIRELFGALTQDLSIWRSLAAKYNSDLFVGLFMREENEGVRISVKSLEFLSQRGVLLDFDIYEPPGRSDG